MISASQRRYWPYDEVTASRDSESSRFSVSSPWLRGEIEVEEHDAARVDRIARKLSAGTLSSDDLVDVTWLFSALSHVPLAYVLPRSEVAPGSDAHELRDRKLGSVGPRDLLAQLRQPVPGARAEGPPARNRKAPPPAPSAWIAQVPAEWKWDLRAALDFSEIPAVTAKKATRHDPATLFSVVRRFHLLDTVENDQTDALLARIRSLRGEPVRFRKAAALAVRQNHFIAQRSKAALRPALQIAQGAAGELFRFIRLESGRELGLEKALKTLGTSPEKLVVAEPTVVLTEIFSLIARRNLLAFAMAVDILGRSHYRREDPLAALLEENGQAQAARQISLHRQAGKVLGRENIGLELLEWMGPVGAAYATEALRLAELATVVLHQISASLLRGLAA